jgi:hypothetical protein
MECALMALNPVMIHLLSWLPGRFTRCHKYNPCLVARSICVLLAL